MQNQVTDALGNRTIYLVLERWAGHSDPLVTEHELLTSREAALEFVRDNDRAERVFEISYDAPRRDISEDLAREWLAALIDDGFDPHEDTWPTFISAHLTNDEAAAMHDENETWKDVA